ncbi:basic helix-loop-helix (bHLH) DNA-binding superfamily protein [Rhynchospora pubera]|uniref:Basic helix-loop-helix (BHLH) DNA-binding superfamily protein n=1 Tax=Rhynchospora pubera TaxID=906938 RepID=A0AAV8HNR9_9POAL|nr:basic helix-loop-helix (bHLH) DNA-binding superfamily protein [Rhynchospora pubera]
MELSLNEWYSQLELEDIIPDIEPLAVDQLAESLAKDLQNDNPQFNQENYNLPSGIFNFGRTSSSNFSQGEPAPSSHKVISWGDEELKNIDLHALAKSNVKASSSRLPHYAEEHVLAERKRREKLSQQFLALATLVPELKKTDKVSLLDGAIDHLKTLEQRVKDLEEKTKMTGEKSQPSPVLLTQVRDRNNSEELEVNSESLPKVEASLQGNIILIRIQCEKRKGALVMVLSQIDKLCLSVINTSVVQFGGTLNMTITVEAKEGFSLTVADVIRKLNSAIRLFQ